MDAVTVASGPAAGEKLTHTARLSGRGRFRLAAIEALLSNDMKNPLRRRATFFP
jgi:hypothetical protein